MTESSPSAQGAPPAPVEVQLLDQIVIDPARLPDLLVLLEQWLPECGARGMTMQQRWVSPPVAVPGQPNTLWLLWQVPSLWAYYGLHTSGGERTVAFWSAVDALALSRQRHLLGDAGVPLAWPQEHDHAA